MGSGPCAFYVHKHRRIEGVGHVLFVSVLRGEMRRQDEVQLGEQPHRYDPSVVSKIESFRDDVSVAKAGDYVSFRAARLNARPQRGTVDGDVRCSPAITQPETVSCFTCLARVFQPIVDKANGSTLLGSTVKLLYRFGAVDCLVCEIVAQGGKAGRTCRAGDVVTISIKAQRYIHVGSTKFWPEMCKVMLMSNQTAEILAAGTVSEVNHWHFLGLSAGWVTGPYPYDKFARRFVPLLHYTLPDVETVLATSLIDLIALADVEKNVTAAEESVMNFVLAGGTAIITPAHGESPGGLLSRFGLSWAPLSSYETSWSH